MRVMEIIGRDGRFQLSPGQRERPAPKAGEVLIAVAAAGVNGHDVHHIHQGRHPIAPGESDLPGLEVAGTIVALGEGARRWSVGDKVCALLRGGGYAEFATAPDGNCLPVPKGLTLVEAASLPETMFTVWSNVVVDAGLAEGESFLMNGGTSGIGVMAIQMFSALGHKVFATARGAEKAVICRELGAVLAIDYETEDFAKAILAHTGGDGADVILDIVGGDYLMKDLDAAAKHGRIVFIAAARGYRTEIDIAKLMNKHLSVRGSLLRPRSNEEKYAVAQALEARIWPLVEAGRIKPIVDQVFPLKQAADAIAVLEQRGHVGKVMLAVG